MTKFLKSIICMAMLAILCPASADACTSMLVSAKASATGRPLMWKNRDTGTEHNFVQRVNAVNGKIGYVALFDGGDTELKQAWMGMNDAGFAIMNTASYNVQPDTARFKDREGYVMSLALQNCRNVNEFESLLRNLPKPMGVQANFGVMDAKGGLAYFEVNDHVYKRYNVADTESGYMIRTNFSMAGTKGDGYGYIRYNNVQEILKPEMESGTLSPEAFTEKASKSFYHSLMKHDFLTDTCTWIIDQDFIPRNSTSASVVIEGVNPGQSVNDMVMWTVIGYPPCSVVMPVTLNNVPRDLQPIAEGFRSPLCNRAVELKHKIFPITQGNGQHYIYLPMLKQTLKAARDASINLYSKFRSPYWVPDDYQAPQPKEEKTDKNKKK